MENLDSRVRFGILAGGILVSFIIVGVLQEKVTKTKYGADENGDGGEKFVFSAMLVAVQCAIYAVAAKIIMMIKKEKEDQTHQLYFAVIAIAYCMSMVFTVWALQYVSYPMQVIGRSAKPISVMILSVLIARKTYTPQRYLFVCTVVIGAALFLLEPGHEIEKRKKDDLAVGYVLLMASLLMDGLLGAIQDRLCAACNPSTLNMMFSVNLWTVAYTGTFALLGGEYCRFYDFVQRFPYVSYNIGILSTAGLCGQICVWNMVAMFGSLPCSIVTTSRKFLTVLFSVFYYNHPLVIRQWIGIVMVFGSLFADAFLGKRKPKQSNTPSNGDIEKNDKSKEIAEIELLRPKVVIETCCK